MARTLNAPDDIKNYPDNLALSRNFNFASVPNHPQAPIPGVGGRVIEAQWGVVYVLDENGEPTASVLHPAESVSFAETAEGGWDKATALRLS